MTSKFAPKEPWSGGKSWPLKGTAIPELTETVAAAVDAQPSEPRPVLTGSAAVRLETPQPTNGPNVKKTWRETVVDAVHSMGDNRPALVWPHERRM